ncbi:MAG: AI-2E family transporter [Candidatus Pacebacteria bacterium]|nr:AI-2E family transporter [Candidatus Paceibacterota bacterium]
MKFLNIKDTFFFGILFSISILFFWLIGNFMMPIFWAIVFGIVFYPFYNLIFNKLKEKSTIASLLTIFIILLVILIPVYLVFGLAAKEIITVYKGFTSNNGDINQYFNSIPYQNEIEIFLTDKGFNIDEVKETIFSGIQNIASSLSEQAISFGKYTFNTVISFFIMLYLLFFIFKDGKKILKRISEILPIGNNREERIFRKFTEIVRAIFKGTLIIALMQGVLGGILFYVTGVNTVLLWTMAMIILATIPAVGPTIILFPAGIIFLLTGGIWQGILLIIGALIISILDNILRPLLVGNATHMHDILITISMFGGLSLFGITGFIIGPVIAGMFLTVWLMFEEKFKIELKEQG